MACLLVADGPAKGQQFALENHRVIMVGRDAQCTFQIVDERISRRHLQIRFSEDEGRHFAADFGSANGVLVNESQITSETLLSDGDKIRIGESTLVYSVEDSPDAKGIWELLRRHGPGWEATSLDS